METPSPSPLMSPAIVLPTDAATPKKKGVDLPSWLAILILLVVAGGFGYLGWRLLKPDAPVDLSQYEPNERMRRGWSPQNAVVRVAPAAPQPLPEGVTLDSNGSGTARVNGMSTSFLVSGNKINIVISAPPRTGISPEDTMAARMRALAMNDAARRQAANITPEQLTKLGALKFAAMPQVDAAGRKKLTDLWTKLRSADAAARPAVEQEIMTALREVAAARTAADVAAYHATAEQIRGILSADQMAKLRAPAK
jgi:hypothetical protein